MKKLIVQYQTNLKYRVESSDEVRDKIPRQIPFNILLLATFIFLFSRYLMSLNRNVMEITKLNRTLHCINHQ